MSGSAKRPALGRGLASLMNQVLPEEPSSKELPVDCLVPNRQQPRTHFDPEALANLAVSLKHHGMVQPIVARKVGDKHEIIAGERRWRAAQLAGLEKVPVVLRDVPDDQMLEIALVENIQRQELNPIEEAKAYWQLGEHLRLTQEEVADRVGKSRPQVANTLRLLRLPTPIQNLVANGQVSPGHAKVLLGVDDSRVQESLAQEVFQKQLSVRVLESKVEQLSREKKAKVKKPSGDVFTRAAAEELTLVWSTKVEIQPKGRGGTLVFHYASEQELDRLFEGLKQISAVHA